MGLEKEIRLFTQPYREALESGIVEELEAIGIVAGSGDAELHEGPFNEKTMRIANHCLRDEASELDADYVFGIGYQAFERSTGYSLLATGDAYKIKNPKA